MLEVDLTIWGAIQQRLDEHTATEGLQHDGTLLALAITTTYLTFWASARRTACWDVDLPRFVPASGLNINCLGTTL